MPPQWHRLHLSQDGVPSLLFQYTWTQQGYEVHVTDLFYIWSERLPHGAIIKRAGEDATTIDPAEDPEQLNVLLEKIGEALYKGKESAVLSSGSQPDSIEITTTTKLPAPLEPLRWSLKLTKEPLSSLTRNLLLPLLKEEAKWESRQRSLLDQIKQKDYVLGKLFDKLETLGVDLGTVFPSAARSRTSRQGVTRSEASRFVKGIAPFEEQEWLAADGGNGFATTLLHELSESNGGVETIQSQGEWWRQLARPDTSVRDSPPTEEQIEEKTKNFEPEEIDIEGDSTASSDVDEFQRQETPPRLKSRNPRSPPKARKKSPRPPALPTEADEATASDTDEESEPVPVRQRQVTVSRLPEPAAPKPQTREPPKKSKGRLGKIGGKPRKEPSPQPSPPPRSRSSPQTQVVAKNPKGGLGKIGGKKKQTDTLPPEARRSPESQDPPEQKRAPLSASPESTSKAKRPSKLGTIGGKAKSKIPGPARDETPPRSSKTGATTPQQPSPAKSNTSQYRVKEDSPLPARAVEKASSAPLEESETEDQRADRKREELKRSLEAKSKAPAKKKRRF